MAEEKVLWETHDMPFQESYRLRLMGDLTPRGEIGSLAEPISPCGATEPWNWSLPKGTP